MSIGKELNPLFVTNILHCALVYVFVKNFPFGLYDVR